MNNEDPERQNFQEREKQLDIKEDSDDDQQMLIKELTPSSKKESNGGNGQAALDQDQQQGCISNKVKAIIAMNGYCLFLVMSQDFAKIAQNQGVNVLDLCLIRSMMNFASALVSNAAMGQACCGFTCEHVGPLITRSFTGLLTFGGLIYGCELMPLFLANIMMNTGPFWAALLAFLVLGETVRCIDIICMFGCFIGVIVLATAPAPRVDVKFGANATHSAFSVLFDHAKNYAKDHVASATSALQMESHKVGNITNALNNKTKHVLTAEQLREDHYIEGILVCIMAALAQAVSGVCTRKTKELSYAVFIFAYGMFASTIMFVILFIDYCIYYWGKTPRIATYSKEEWGYIILCAFVSSLCCNCFTIAIQSYKLGFVMIIVYETLVYALISDLAIFHYSFGWQSILGALIILAFSVWAVVQKLTAAEDDKPQEQEVRSGSNSQEGNQQDEDQ